MKFGKKSFPALYEIYSNDENAKGNITKTAKKYCELNNIAYDDTSRRAASKILNRGMIKKDLPLVVNKEKHHSAKILFFDIETSFIEYRGFSLYPNSIPHDNIINDWYILSFSAKWIFEDNFTSVGLTPQEISKQDDKRLCQEIWKLIDEADIIVAHNGNRFDIRKLNSRFIKHNLLLPSPFKSIDTLYHAKRVFGFTSNRLDYIAKFLGFDGKIENSKGLWHRVMAGEVEAMDLMIEYTEQDVRILEEVYLAMRPYMKGHVNLGLFITENAEACPSCASNEIDWNLKTDYITTSNVYRAGRCCSCGSLMRARTPLYNAKNKSSLLIPLAGIYFKGGINFSPFLF